MPAPWHLPLSFATIIGGTLTLIGTSTNLLASDLAAGLGYGSFQLFSFTAIGIPLWLLGSAYLLLSSLWLPDRGDGDHTSLRDLSREGYLTEVVLPPESPLVGLTLHDSRLQRRFDLDVLEVHRGSQKLQPPLAQLRLAAADRLLLRCNRSELLRLQQDRMVALAGTLLAPEPPHIRDAEVLVPSGSLLAGTSLRELRFRQRFNATVLAAKRTGTILRDRLGRLVLREGDLLLIQAPLDALCGLHQSRDLVVLDQLDDDLPTTHRKHLAVAVMAAVLLLSGLGVMPLVAAVLLGVGVLVIGGCLDAGSTLRAIRWDIYLLLGGLYSLSAALQQSGLAALVANRLLAKIHTWPAYAALLAVYGLTLITTVVFAASQSFSSPIVYQTNLMVFAPGRYCLLDELRYGWPLSLLDTVTVTAFVLWLG